MANEKKNIRIVICVNNEELHERIELYLKKYTEQKDITYTTVHYYNGKQLIQDRDFYDLLFLTLELTDYDGIDLGRELRKRGDNCQIIMIMDCIDSAIKAFEIEASRVLVNPFYYDIFVNVNIKMFKSSKVKM